MKLADLSYPEAAAILERGALALWPAGSTEAHGPHLPLATDVIIAEETCRRAVPALKEALGLDALILPPLTFTVTDYAGPFTGTVSVPSETTTAYVRDVLLGVAKQGFRAICIVNAHLEPGHRFALRDAVKAARPTAACPLALADPCDRRWVSTLTEEFQSGKCHAGQYESSLVMAARPDLVDELRRTSLPTVDIDLVGSMKSGLTNFSQMGADQAYFGTPQHATPEEGDTSYQKLVKMVVTMTREALA
ncbi:MAG: creatininase family protein [Myxococcota bacterium]